MCMFYAAYKTFVVGEYTRFIWGRVIGHPEYDPQQQQYCCDQQERWVLNNWGDGHNHWLSQTSKSGIWGPAITSTSQNRDKIHCMETFPLTHGYYKDNLSWRNTWDSTDAGENTSWNSLNLRCRHAQSWLTRCGPMDCSPPGSSVNQIFQARMLEWIAFSFSRGSPQPRDQTHIHCVSCISR